jgi:hypothetical protein
MLGTVGDRSVQQESRCTIASVGPCLLTLHMNGNSKFASIAWLPGTRYTRRLAQAARETVSIDDS